MKKQKNSKKAFIKKTTPAPLQNISTPKVAQFKVQPLYDRVIIKEDLSNIEQTTASGIIIPVTAQEDKGGKRGRIVAVGNGKVDDGILIPVSVSVGDVVLFQWGDKIKVDNEEYYIVRESEILAILNS